MKKLCFCHSVALLLVAMFLLGFCPLALADDEVSVRVRKGNAPAEGTWLDESFDGDVESYENSPVDIALVRIGISFDDSAVDQAVFRSIESSGFRFGIYDSNRAFVERGRTDRDELLITWAADPQFGLMILGGPERDVLYVSRGEDSLAVEVLAGETAYGSERYLGGFECRKTGDGLMTVLNCVDLENYVKGVVPYEMGSDWPMEALKAQAVCARTYIVYNQHEYEEFGFDLADNTESQVYRGTAWANARTDAAVDATCGQVLRYRGEVCQSYYFAADGGSTEDGSLVFGSDHPYLCGKPDPFESAIEYPFQSWTRRYTPEGLADRLTRSGFPIDPVVSVTPEYSSQGNVIALDFLSTSGQSLRLTGKECYQGLRLPSIRFTVTKTAAGITIFQGSGLGHNCGMSQWGARAMDEIYGFNYRQILAFYFTGAYVL